VRIAAMKCPGPKGRWLSRLARYSLEAERLAAFKVDPTDVDHLAGQRLGRKQLGMT